MSKQRKQFFFPYNGGFILSFARDKSDEEIQAIVEYLNGQEFREKVDAFAYRTGCGHLVPLKSHMLSDLLFGDKAGVN